MCYMVLNNKCKICRDIKLSKKIDDLIAEGNSVNMTANILKIPESSLRRHRKICGVENPQPKVPFAAYKPKKKKDSTFRSENSEIKEHAQMLVDGCELSTSKMSSNIKYLFAHAIDVLHIAKEGEEHSLRLKAIREARSTLELVIKASQLFVSGEAQADWNNVLDTIIEVLDKYPRAKKAVTDALYNS